MDGSQNPGITDVTSGRDMALTDANDIVVFNHASVAGSFPIPAQSEITWPEGTVLTLMQIGAAAASFTDDGGAVTLEIKTGKTATTDGDSTVISAIRRASDVWVVIGGADS